MAVYRDIDSDVRINGSLLLPSGSLVMGEVNILNELSAKTPNTRTISVGTGLSGGGNLSADRTISVTFGTTAGTVAQGNHTHTFASLTSKPTTLAGYGITDAAATSHTHTFASLTSKPTTIAGYGITDAALSTHNHDAVYLKLTGGTISGDLSGSLLTTGSRQLLRHAASAIYLGNTSTPLYLESSVDPTIKIGTSANHKIFHAGNFDPATKLNTTANAASASKWATARTLTLSGAVTGNVNIDGSGNVIMETAVNHQHSLLSIPDYRDTQQMPTDIPNSSVTASFKNKTVVGSPPVENGSNFAHLLNMNAWNSGNNGTGGHTSQLAFGDGLAIRLSTSTTAWGPWRKFWHDGNLNPANFLTNGASQTVGNNFTVNGKLNIGNINNTGGDVVVYGDTGLPRIHLDGNASGAESTTNTNIYLNGDGNANFKGTVTVNTLKVTARGLVENLNAQYLNGLQEVSFVKNVTTVDNTGYGIVKGLDAIAYGGELHVSPGIAYTASGMRTNITAQTKVNMTPASTSSSRYDVVYIKGPSTSTQEGTLGYLEGGATKAAALAQGLLNDAVVIAVVLRTMNQASIVQADIDNTVRDLDGTIGTKPLFLDAETKHVKARYEVHAKKFKENGQYLEYYYARLNTANTFNANQKINGRVHINASGSLGGVATSGNYGLRVGTDSSYIAMDENEMLATGSLSMRALGGELVLASSTKIALDSNVRAPRSAITVTIPKGQRAVTVPHAYGSTSYALALTPNSFARHVKWRDKLATSVVIEIDDVYDQDILIDCLLIGY